MNKTVADAERLGMHKLAARRRKIEAYAVLHAEKSWGLFSVAGALPVELPNGLAPIGATLRGVLMERFATREEADAAAIDAGYEAFVERVS